MLHHDTALDVKRLTPFTSSHVHVDLLSISAMIGELNDANIVFSVS
jgi:hypothetical protein